MVISGQATGSPRLEQKGPRARMHKIMRDTAIRLMQHGHVPSVSDIAEAAEVSRATAYRHFSSQASIIQAAVNEALGPILDWSSDSTDAEERISDLIAFAYPRMNRHEATHRAALRLALDQWERSHAGTVDGETRIVRGNRKMLLTAAARPLLNGVGAKTFDRLIQSLSLLFGVEALIVLKDIWGLDGREAEKVADWAAHALVRAAALEPRRRKTRRANQRAPRSHKNGGLTK